jgi:phosphatidylserine/phosphatidylglycerophosphate/cardiolipin synthase-like enzyme
MTTRRAIPLLFALALTACDLGADEAPVRGPDTIEFNTFKGDDPRSPDTVLDTALGNADEAGALFELVITDVWGRLPDRPSSLSLERRGGAAVKLKGYLEPVALRLVDPGEYRLEVRIPEHETEVVWFTVNDRGEIPVPQDQVSHWSFSVDPGPLGRVNTLYIGVEHKSFAASGPAPRRGNDVVLFDNGRDAYARLADDLATVEERAHFSYWLVKEDFELTRDPDWANTTESDRRENTILAWLDRLPGDRRMLLNEFWGDADFVNEIAVLDPGLLERAETPNDGIEIMLQPNETEVPYYDDIPLRDDEWSYRERLLNSNPEWAEREFKNEEAVRPSIYDRDVSWTDLQAGSWHQKFVTLDQKIAFVGGMNMNYADWDEGDLRVYNPRRAPIDADTSHRMAIESGHEASLTRPRRDYMVRVTGRIVDDVEALFQKRWDLARSGQDHAENSSSFNRDVPADPRGAVPGVEVQLNVTTPMPFWEHSILEGMRRAIDQAEQYIFIEDQYFRAPLMNALITQRMNAVPGLKLIVVTNPVDYSDPGRKWTAIAHQEFQEAFPERYLLLCLKANDIREWGNGTRAVTANVDLHAKMFIVDDEIMSVGSANKNNRGLIYEGEANLLIRDLAFVSSARRQIWIDYVGPEFAGQIGDPDEAFEVFQTIAMRNQQIIDTWAEYEGQLPAGVFDESLRPQGLLYPLEIPYRWWFNVGPDGI